MVAKIARNGCDRDRLRVSIRSPMPKWPKYFFLFKMGYFGVGDINDARDLSLSRPFLAILATIAYILDTHLLSDAMEHVFIFRIILTNLFSVADIVILLILFRTTLELEFCSTMCFSFQFYIFGSDWVHFGTSGGCTDINIPFIWLDGRLPLARFYVSAHFYSFLFIFHLLQKFCITTKNCNDVTNSFNFIFFSDLNRT